MNSIGALLGHPVHYSDSSSDRFSPTRRRQWIWRQIVSGDAGGRKIKEPQGEGGRSNGQDDIFISIW